MAAERYEYKVLEAGWSTLTDRFFPVVALKSIAQQFKPSVGEYVFPFERISRQVDMGRVSHSILSLKLKGDTELWAEIRPLNTPRGLLLKDHMKSNNVSFVVNLMGVVNYCNEIQPASVQYLHVSAHGSFK